MSWIVEPRLTFFQRLALNVIKCGPVPKHIAFIMDGNRRFATKTHVKSSEGHLKGFDKLAETLHWCRELGITEVTVYAFSIENFKRSKEEVDTLMLLATEKFQKFLEEKEQIMAHGVCIRIIGNLTMLPRELQKLVAEVTLLTKDNNNAVLNVAFAYTSRDEIVQSAKIVVDGVERGLIEVEDVDQGLVSGCLHTSKSKDPEVIIRTSGEARFSDFMLWQISRSHICFEKVLWPEFNIWYFLACVFVYQSHYERLKLDKSESGCCRSDNAKNYIEHVQQQRLMQLSNSLV